jgi:hypothetical protein
MDVKCMRLKRIYARSWQPNMVAHDIARSGKAVLGAIRDSDGQVTNRHKQNIELNKFMLDQKDKDHPNAPPMPRCEAVAILGGRSSIVNWLKLHGDEPGIYNGLGDHELHIYVARKHQRFGKDMTMVLICPEGELVAQGAGDWQIKAPYDLRNAPESAMSPYTNKRISDTNPQKLATTLSRAFAGSGF